MWCAMGKRDMDCYKCIRKDNEEGNYLDFITLNVSVYTEPWTSVKFFAAQLKATIFIQRVGKMIL